VVVERGVKITKGSRGRGDDDQLWQKVDVEKLQNVLDCSGLRKEEVWRGRQRRWGKGSIDVGERSHLIMSCQAGMEG
jgi:hypothetical protein